MPKHTLFIPGLRAKVGDPLTVIGDEAKHATRVKRVEPGNTVAILTGQGIAYRAKVRTAHRDLTLEILAVDQLTPPTPRIELCTATPKGPRLDKMIDMLSQLGVAQWSPLDTALGVVEPGDNKLERLDRIALESAKQCGRGHLMTIGQRTTIDHTLNLAASKAWTVLVADAFGDPPPPPTLPPATTGVLALVGPEGGFLPEELEQLAAGGATLVRLGNHVLRTETAAVAFAATLAATHHLPPAPR